MKIGETIYWDHYVSYHTWKEGEVISFDEETVCVLTYDQYCYRPVFLRADQPFFKSVEEYERWKKTFIIE